jgi:hypothetical protein
VQTVSSLLSNLFSQLPSNLRFETPSILCTTRGLVEYTPWGVCVHPVGGLAYTPWGGWHTPRGVHGIHPVGCTFHNVLG